MALSAAELQRRHDLEGAPDPFPSLSENSHPGPREKAKPGPPALDTQSEDAFPSLASATPGPAAQAQSAWGNGPRIKAPVVPKVPVFTDTFTLAAMDLSNAGRDGKSASLGEVMKTVMAKYKVKIEASGNQRTRQTTFHIKGESQKELDKAKRSLLALTSPYITLVINAPVSTIPSLIGTKGATLKAIRDQTSVRVDIPKREAIDGQANGHTAAKDSPTGDDEEEPTVPVTLYGPQPLAYEAQEMLKKIIRERTWHGTSRVKDIPAHILPFVITRRAHFLAVAEGSEVTLQLDQPAREITISGDREAVGRVAESIKGVIEHFKTALTSLKISLPKRQHRLLAGTAIDKIMANSKCSVTVPAHDEAGDEVTIWGEANDLSQGLAAVMEQANSKYIHEFPLPGPLSVSKQLVTYILRVDYVKTLQDGHEDVDIHLPSLNSGQSSLSIDLIGDKSQTDEVVKKISGLIGKLYGGTRSLDIDWRSHRIIQGKNAKKLEQYHETHNVNVYFPAESDESSSVLLVYDPFSAKASPVPDEKQKNLNKVEKELLKFAKDAADVKTVKVDVEKKWHETVGGATLDRIIGEDTTLSIKLGADAGEGTEDIIVVRGLSSDVDRVVNEINQIVKDAKEDEILSSYFLDFEIDKEYVGRIVGSQGSGIHKLRDQFGVKVDISDEGDEKDGGKKKKTQQKSKITVTGRQEKAEEAKKHILALVERLADETSEVIKIPVQYHSSLIGQAGKYVIRLEDKYLVKITFPRQSSDSGEGRTREQLKPDEVLLKGGKKGVAQAKAELLDALEFEKENNHTSTFTIPTRAVARVLGRAGSTINEIKNDTGAEIDVEKGYEETTTITLKGTKAAISEAKTAILAISDQVGEETTETITIENKYHRSIIGAGGQGLRELIAKCNGPTDSKTQAGLIRFPRQGETGDEVRLRGDPKLVAKLKAELESLAATLRDRVILGVEIPAAQHRALIGRGGAHLNEVQDKFGVQIQIPGSRSYHQIGDPQNAEDLDGVDAANIVKVTGSRSNVDAAILHLKANVKPPPSEAVTKDITVPLKYHQAISQQGNFFRTLRSFGVTVDHSAMPTKAGLPPAPAAEGASEARIDDDTDAEVPASQWQVVENYKDVDEGDSTWTLKGNDEASLAKAEKLVVQGIENAVKKTHVGYLTLADRSSFPRIVGTRGANVARLRDESGADITVGRDNNVIVIVGSETEVTNAKNAILELAASRGQGRRRND